MTAKAAFVFIVCLFLALSHVGQASSTFGRPRVRTATFKVLVPELGSGTYNIRGYLFYKSGDRSYCSSGDNETVQVLVPGFRYGAEYWNADTINGVDYSYSRYMASQCKFVLAIDLLGVGQSDKPDGDLVGVNAESSALRAILTSLKTFPNPTRFQFSRIVLVGHSLGSAVSIYTLGRFPDAADALVVTGYLQGPISTYSLSGDVSQPYITADVSEPLFYFEPTADSAVIAYDNAQLKRSTPRRLAFDAFGIIQARLNADMAQVLLLGLADRVTVKVLLQYAEYDGIFVAPASAAALQHEVALFSGASSVDTSFLGSMGHSLNLHFNRLKSWQAIHDWIEA